MRVRKGKWRRGMGKDGEGREEEMEGRRSGRGK